MSRFIEASREIEGSSWLDNLARASLRAAAAKFEGYTTPVLSIEASREIVASDLALVAQQVQVAVARMGYSMQNPRSDAVQLREFDRNNAKLYPLRQAGRIMEFAFESQQPDQHALFDAGVPTLAEKAARELVTLLPENSDDEDSVNSVAAHSRAVRNVLKDVVSAVEQTTVGLGFTMSVAGETVQSTLTDSQARMISAELSEERVESQRITVTGKLDGMRTRRRIFYFETGSQTFAGAFDAELENTVKQHIGSKATAQIERTRRVRNAGPAGRWTYRLVGLTDAEPGLERDLFDD